MGAAYFYHVTQSSIEQTLPMLLGKARQAGWRIEVRGQHADDMERLDKQLWLGDENGFDPHGLAGGDYDADQPVLLTFGQAAGNNPTCVMSVYGADVTPQDVTALERVCILFDGHDGAAVAHARVQWKTLADAGCTAQYWSQESGRWEKKAETA
ncbi:DNA polymerase III subunit chi [Aestuariibius sp. HNIBRBA575]|uniref:DNA polymerase III subunit chi n=1 Tax=Aestuariibius sp. HNIBRBA575 TaxID=3233343 RepID=UPI0034A2663E